MSSINQTNSDADFRSALLHMRVLMPVLLCILLKLASPVQADLPGFEVKKAPGDMLYLNYNGRNLLPGCQFYFADSEWRILQRVNMEELEVDCKEGEWSAIATNDVADIVSYNLNLKWNENSFTVAFEYCLPQNSPLKFAVADIFLNHQLFSSVNAVGLEQVNGTEFDALGRAVNLRFHSALGNVRAEFNVCDVAENIEDGHWVLRSTQHQKWRSDELRYMSLLHCGTKNGDGALHRRATACFQVRPSQKGVVPEQKEQGQTEADRVEDRTGDSAPPAFTVIPQPQKIEIPKSGGRFLFSQKQVTVVCEQLSQSEKDFFFSELHDEFLSYHGIFAERGQISELPEGEAVIILRLISSETKAIPSLPKNPEGYHLEVTPRQIHLSAWQVKGLFHGLQTLYQLIQEQDNIISVPCLTIADWPDMSFRGLMLICGYSNVEYFKRIIKRIACRFKYSHLIIGGGDIGHIRWESHPGLAVPGLCWTPKELKECVDFAKRHYLEVIPQISCMGHQAEIRKRHPELAENPTGGNVICLSNPDARRLITEIYEEAIEIFQPWEFLIGCDEAKPIGVCPACSKLSPADLVASHINWFYNWLGERGIKTMIWHDMLLNHQVWQEHAPTSANSDNPPVYQAVTHPAVQKLNRNITINVWIYEPLREYPVLDHFMSLGFPVVGASWHDSVNNFNMAQAVKKRRARGLLGTSWGLLSSAAGRQVLNPNMMSLLSAEYSWSSDTPELADISYSPTAKLADALAAPLHAHRSVAFISIDTAANYTPKTLQTALRRSPLEYDLFEKLKDRKFVTVAGKNLKYLDLPQCTRRIPISRKLTSLHFLHTAQHVGYGKRIGYYRVQYEDGVEETVPLVEMRNIAPLQMPEFYPDSLSKSSYRSFILPEARLVWTGRSRFGTELAMHAYEWVNPFPDKPVASVLLTTDSPAAEITLLALSATMSKKP